MKRFEYVLSLMAAMLLLGGVVAWTQVHQQQQPTDTATISCRTAQPPTLRGLSVARCTPGKRS